MSLEDEERYLIVQIQTIQEAYQRQIQPYVDRLVRLRSLNPQPFVIDVEKLPEHLKERLRQEWEKDLKGPAA